MEDSLLISVVVPVFNEEESTNNGPVFKRKQKN